MQTTYPVNEIYLAIQGEGRLAGMPMVILRLQGCDVGCPWCDTKQTWELSHDFQVGEISLIHDTPEHWAYASPEQIVAEIRRIGGDEFKWVLLTGGEPATYYLHPLLHGLHNAGYMVALETSGAKSVDITSEKFDWFTVSPKAPDPAPGIFPQADEIKMVIVKPADIQRLERFIRDNPLKPDVTISLQPVSQSKHSTDLCIQAIMQRPAWRLSLQLHKYVGLP